MFVCTWFCYFLLCMHVSHLVALKCQRQWIMQTCVAFDSLQIYQSLCMSGSRKKNLVWYIRFSLRKNWLYSGLAWPTQWRYALPMKYIFIFATNSFNLFVFMLLSLFVSVLFSRSQAPAKCFACIGTVCWLHFLLPSDVHMRVRWFRTRTKTFMWMQYFWRLLLLHDACVQ